MPITDPLVLPVDVTITPVRALGASLRGRLRADDDDCLVTRPRGRATSKVVSAEAAGFLEEFRSARRISEVVLDVAARRAGDPEALLAQAFPLLRDCFNGRFLVAADSPEAAPILPTRERGDRIGPFEVLRCLRVRNDTELYQARGDDGRLAAVKLARPGSGSDVTRMLTREAGVLARLRGAGAPRLAAAGRHRRRAWLASAWCGGVTPDVVAGELRERGTAEARGRLLDLVTAVAAAFARLHRRGVVHGDVHASNLLVGRGDRIRMLDFGLARAIPPTRLPGTPATGGVAAFYAPEYARAALAGRRTPEPDPGSEQYAVAALLYLLLTGRTYADFDLDRSTMLEQIRSDPPLPFTARQAPPWPEVERILARALSKDASARFGSMAALTAALRELPRVTAGARAPTRTPRPAADALGEFIARTRINGPAFPKDGEVTGVPPVCSFKFGGAGVAYVLYRLAVIRDDGRHLATADAWLTRTEAAVDSPVAFAAPGTVLVPESLGPVSPFHARPGVDLVRALLAVSMRDRWSAVNAAERYVAASRTECPVVDLTLGRPGILLGCALLVEALPQVEKSGLVAKAVRQLGDEVLEWLWSILAPFGPVGRCEELDDYGVAHGWAGLLYATLRWSRAARRELPAGVTRRLGELAACAEPVGRGIHWWPRQHPDASRVELGHEMVGWCVGPAGFIHLWTLAHERLRDPRYLRLAESSAWSAWEGRSGVPDLCCGLAGRAYGLLNLYRATGAPEWLERARILAGRAADRIASWKGAQVRPLSLYKGLGGVAVLLADLERPEASCLPLFEPVGWPEPSEPRTD